MKNLSPSQKRARIRSSFEAKVSRLEEWVKTGIPAGTKLPLTRTALRVWTDEAGGLVPWSDDQVDDPRGRNADLYVRYASAMEMLRVKHSKTKEVRAHKLTEEIHILKRANEHLVLQNATLIARLNASEEEIARLRDILAAKKSF